MPICLPCQLGLTAECTEETLCESVPAATIITAPPKEEKSSEPRTRELKQDDEVTDAASTGRKRAAVAYKIEEGMICEWMGLKNAGGGQNPIIGCTGNPATNRHHGPDKSTLNNSTGNVHRICTKCHNRWHAKNDPTYNDYLSSIGGAENLPAHDSTSKATAEELYQNETHWEKRR